MIFDRYIRKNIIGSVFLVMFVVLCLHVFFAFVSDVKYVAKYERVGYLDVLWSVLIDLPDQFTSFIPAVVMTGCLFGMGNMSGNNELVAMRSVGYSKLSIVISGIKSGLIFCLFMLVMAQFVTPKTIMYSQEFWALKKGKAVKEHFSNYWTLLKQGEIDRYVHVGQIRANGELMDIDVYDAKGNKLVQTIHAGAATYQEGAWALKKAVLQVHASELSQKEERETLALTNFLPVDVYSLANVRPKTLSLTDLYAYSRYLDANNLDNYAYVKEFWNKITSALSILVMILISMPFVFTSRRSGNAGVKLLIGVVVGMVYHICSQMISNLGQIYGWNVMLCAFTPLIMFTTVGVVFLKRN